MRKRMELEHRTTTNLTNRAVKKFQTKSACAQFLPSSGRVSFGGTPSLALPAPVATPRGLPPVPRPNPGAGAANKEISPCSLYSLFQAAPAQAERSTEKMSCLDFLHQATINVNPEDVPVVSEVHELVDEVHNGLIPEAVG